MQATIIIQIVSDLAFWIINLSFFVYLIDYLFKVQNMSAAVAIALKNLLLSLSRRSVSRKHSCESAFG